MKNNGFTTLELIVVIIILAILAATALPSYINIASDARIQALIHLKSQVKSANDLLFIKSHLPSYSVRPVTGRADLIDIDMDNDGDFDVFAADGIDVRLKWFYLDNTDIKKRITYSTDFSLQEEGVDFTYIGYDLNHNGSVKDDRCYFKYTQAQSVSIPAAYEIVSTGC
jgi:prepilin-type N-terminal cleavage/methylation domain-containing protein